MSDYTKATNFTAKDTLPTGNAGKIVKGAEIDTEFTSVASAIASKANSNSPIFTGTITFTGTLTGGTGVVNLGSGQFVKDASGNIGIGATSTGAQLYQYLSSGTTQRAMQNGSVISLDYASTTSGTVTYGSVSNHPVVFTVNNAEVMRITTTGTIEGSKFVAVAQSGIGPNEGGELELAGGTSYSSYNKVIDVLAEDFRVFGSGDWDAQIFSTTGTANLTVQGSITAGGNNVLTSANLKGLGLGGETWQNLTGSRSFGVTYTNSTAYPIAVSAHTGSSGPSPYVEVIVNGIRASYFFWQFDGAGAVGGSSPVIVPAGATYKLNANAALAHWAELR